DRLRFDRDVAQAQGAASLRESLGQFGLRLEGDHASLVAPARQPPHKAALVGADITDNVPGPEMAGDDGEFGPLVAIPRLQPANQKTEFFVGGERHGAPVAARLYL